VISRSRVRCVSLNSAIRPTRNGGGNKPRSSVHPDCCGWWCRPAGARSSMRYIAETQRTLWMADSGVEQLRHRIFDDLP